MTGQMRAFNPQQDLEAMTDLIETAFAGELEAWGGDFREQVKMAGQMLPLLTILSRLSQNFQHTFDGFVWEADGRMVSLVNVQKAGFDIKSWMIGNVATHPDYRRRGLARKLVTHALEHAHSLGAEICTLEVRAEATPAYRLYKSLGFAHYDSLTALKLETLPQVQAMPMPGYQVRLMKLGEWRARHQLALQETPQAVQAFLPVSEADFRILPVQYVTNWLARQIQKMSFHRWAVEKDGQLVGVMSLVAHRKAKVHHELNLRLHPEHRQALIEPMLTLALETLQAYPPNLVRTEIRTSYDELIAVLQKYGFGVIDVNHHLGLKFQ